MAERSLRGTRLGATSYENDRNTDLAPFTSAGDLPAPKKVKPPRSHWDMLLERRSVADLEEVLAERLAVIRGQRGITNDVDVSPHSRRQRKSA